MARLVCAAVCVLGVLPGLACVPTTAEVPRQTLRIATGSVDGIYYALGAELAQAYASRIEGANPVALATAASGYNVQAIESGDAELAFALGDVTYLAYTRGTADVPRPHHGIRAIAVLYVNVIHILVRTDSPITRVADLRGRRVAVGRSVVTPPRGGPFLTVEVIAQAHGVESDAVTSKWLTLSEMIAQLGDARLDAGFFSSGYPVPAIAQAASTFGVRLLPVDPAGARRARAQYPFFKLTTIPAGTYPGQSEDVAAFGVDNLLLCRDDMSEDVVYRLTRSFFESLPDVARRIVAARLIDVERAPATPIPLHPGAARYYRERELLRW